MTGGGVLRLLKEGTAAQHDAVERQVDLAHRLRDPSAYAALLGRFYGFYQPVETALGHITGYDSVGINFEERRKTARVVADLAALGHKPEEFPVCTDSPELRTLSDGLGTMYVLEGATLGGRYICKMVETKLGFTPDRGAAFFASYGDRVGPMWEAFRAALVRHAVSPRIEDEIVTVPVRTFECFGRWLAAEGVAP